MRKGWAKPSGASQAGLDRCVADLLRLDGVSTREMLQRRTFYETIISRYNLSHAVPNPPFAGLGSSAGSGMVHRALLHADRTAGAGLAPHSRRPYHADLGSDWIGKN